MQLYSLGFQDRYSPLTQNDDPPIIEHYVASLNDDATTLDGGFLLPVISKSIHIIIMRISRTSMA